MRAIVFLAEKLFIFFFMMYKHRLQGHLKAMNAEKKIMDDWREKCNIVKSDMDAADAIVQEGKKAKTPDEIESCYTKLKVWVCLMCTRKTCHGLIWKKKYA